MNLNEIAHEIRECVENRRKELSLTFVEEDHIYYMKDISGKIKSNFPSVSKVIKNFYVPFDAEAKSLQMANGDVNRQKEILSEWKQAGDYSTNMGSRVHFVLENELVKQYNNFKSVREPIFQCDDQQITRSDNMINAGKNFLELMHERGAVLLDTEMILGDPELGYTGQPDKIWLMMNKEKTGFGFVITDWKTNQPKNFKIQPYTDKMLHPFQNFYNTALSHYYIQLPLYGKLLIKMLEYSKFNNVKLLGCVVVLLKDDGSFEEYRVPPEISQTILQMKRKEYLKK